MLVLGPVHVQNLLFSNKKQDKKKSTATTTALKSAVQKKDKKVGLLFSVMIMEMKMIWYGTLERVYMEDKEEKSI